MVLDFSAKQIISYDAENSPESLSEAYSRIIDGFFTFPLNIPGTAYHQCLKVRIQIFCSLFVYNFSKLKQHLYLLVFGMKY